MFTDDVPRWLFWLGLPIILLLFVYERLLIQLRLWRRSWEGMRG